MWHVSSRSSVATLRTAIHLLLTYVVGLVRVLAPPLKYIELLSLAQQRTALQRAVHV